jgi:hypothetical protein
MKRMFGELIMATAAALVLLAWPARADAHCDTLDGPVVKAAREALASNDVTKVLRWVRAQDEPEIRAAFDRTIRVRKSGAEAREMADQWFFETLVRVHRVGEGAPYLGLQPAGSVEPAIALADRAIEKGSPAALVDELTSSVTKGLRERFSETAAAARRADASVEDGRAFVEKYVEFIHYVERLHLAATTGAGEHKEPGASR